MGIIQKQGTRSSLFLLLGFCIGGINTVILFPKIFSQAEYGLTRAIIDTATILSVLATFGTVPVIYKFHPYYRSHVRSEKSDLAFWSGAICLIGFLLICVTGYAFRDLIIRKLGKSPLFADNFNWVYPATFFMLLFTWMEAFGWALKRTVTTNFLRETLVRLITTLLIILVWLGWINNDQFIGLFSLVFLIPSILLYFTLKNTGEWHFSTSISKVTRRYKHKMAVFGLLIFGASFLNIVSRTVDSFMIIGLKGLEKTAVFTIASYLVTFMDLPFRSINSIATPILSESWKEKNHRNIFTIYQKSTITLLIAGLFIYLMVLLNINNLVLFLSEDWAEVPMVVAVMGLAKLIDLGTGVNGQIIGTSVNWRFDFMTNVLLTLIAIPLNFFLIREFGIMGAAYSNLGALFLYNFIRFGFIYRKYGWQPYNFSHIRIFAVALSIFAVLYMIPFIWNIYIDSAIKSGLFTLLFGFAVYRLKASAEINEFIDKMLEKTRLKPGLKKQK